VGSSSKKKQRILAQFGDTSRPEKMEKSKPSYFTWSNIKKGASIKPTDNKLVHTRFMKTVVCAGDLPDCLDNSKEKLRLLHIQHRRLNLRQLRLVALGGSLPRTRVNYRQRSGARHQLASECEKSPSRSVILSTSATRRSQQRSRARQQLRLRSWL
jgi:hypothetical protein